MSNSLKFTFLFFSSFVFLLGFSFAPKAGFQLSIDGETQYGSVISAFDKSEEVASKTIIFGGDVMLARDSESKIRELGGDYLFSGIIDLLTDKIVVANFEGVVPEVHTRTPNGEMRFSVASEYLSYLSDAGFTHLSLANNHAFDFGQSGFDNTLLELSKNNFEVFGNPDLVSTSSVSYIELSDKTLAIIAINDVGGGSYLLDMVETVQEAAKNSDLQVAFIHWGDEYKLLHNERQEEVAHTLIDVGVDIVVGSHPHVVQDVELYNHSLIFYSLGNLIFDQYFSDDVKEGLLLEMLLDENTVDLVIYPVETHTRPASPALMTGEVREMFLKELAERSSASLKDQILMGKIKFK